MMRHTKRDLGIAAVLLTLCGACSPAQKSEGASKLATFLVGSLPEDAKPAFFDFGSKVQLVGYSVSPEGTAAPGSQVALTLYWRRSAPLEPGWGLFTHIEDDTGRQLRNFDREGAFRTAFDGVKGGLGDLELGKIYVDKQTIELPKAEELTPKVGFIVGVWHDSMRLPVVSGPSNGHEAALVATFTTGVPPRKPAAPTAKNEPSR